MTPEYRRIGFNCKCVIIEVFKFSTQLLKSQSALLLYTRMYKPYANAIIENALHENAETQLFS